MDNNYDTPLNDDEMTAYNQQFSPQDSQDYDMQGWFKDNKDTAMSEGQHYPDTYKKPNHMTFSDESQYHGKDGNEGGKWMQLPDDKFAFRPGSTNMKNHSTSDMIDYFKKVEPHNYLLLGGEE